MSIIAVHAAASNKGMSQNDFSTSTDRYQVIISRLTCDFFCLVPVRANADVSF